MVLPKRFLSFLLITFSLFTSLAFGQEEAFAGPGPAAIKNSAVTFVAEGTDGALTVEGMGGKVDGSPVIDGGKLAGTFSVDLTKLTTVDDIANKLTFGLRDDHMHEKYLQDRCPKEVPGCKKFPKATLVIKNPIQMSGAQNWEGELDLHGVKKTVTGTATFSGDKMNEATFKFTVNIHEFGIETPSYKGITITNLVSLTVDIQFAT